MTYDYDLFTIGAGSGGVRASRVAAAHGARVGIAEDHQVGGTCVIRGCVPKKLLVYGAHFAEDLADLRDRYGSRFRLLHVLSREEQTSELLSGRLDRERLLRIAAALVDPADVDEWFLCAHGKGLKRIAPAAGFGWRDPEAGGENSMRWYRDAVGLDGAAPDPAQRQRLLEYNADDVAATQALREWMTSPAIEEVPLAADL